MSSLGVYFGEQRVGTVELDARDRFSFHYAPSWLESDNRFAISRSLPLRSAPFEEERAHAFFANLLPEGAVRGHVAARLGISADNDFALLAALGGDCAGALSIRPSLEGPPPDASSASYRPLSPSELEQLDRTGNVFSHLAGVDGVRLSLAGAQDKLPVHVDDAGNLRLPLHGASSTHLLKFASRDFAHLTVNEHLMLRVAGRLGLPTVQSMLLSIAERDHLLVTRYDRAIDGDRIARLHQEDFCQVLGVSHHRKYQQEGGPTLEQCFDAVSDYSAEPALDFRALLRWVAFNAVAGNADGHAKNLSLLRHSDGQWRLASFYDLVCTAVYDSLSSRLAMSIGGRDDAMTLHTSHWRTFADRVGLGARLVVDTVREFAEGLEPALDAVSSDVAPDHAAVQMLRRQFRKRARRTLELLASN